MGYWKASSHDLKVKGSGPSFVMVWCLDVDLHDGGLCGTERPCGVD